MIGDYTKTGQGGNYAATDGHNWDPIVVEKGIFDALQIPDGDRTYGISFYEHRKCSNVVHLPCTDVDQDGWLDLYVTCYVELGSKSGVCRYPGGVATACSPTDFPPQQGSLYRNLGGFKFKDVTADVGLDRLAGGAGWFYSHAAAVADYDRDGWPDLLVTGWGRLALFERRRGGFEEVALLESRGTTHAEWAGTTPASAVTREFAEVGA